MSYGLRGASEISKKRNFFRVYDYQIKCHIYGVLSIIWLPCVTLKRFLPYNDLRLTPRPLEDWPRGKNWKSSYFVKMYIISYILRVADHENELRFHIYLIEGFIWPIRHWPPEVQNVNCNILTICISYARRPYDLWRENFLFCA